MMFAVKTGILDAGTDTDCEGEEAFWLSYLDALNALLEHGIRSWKKDNILCDLDGDLHV